MRYRCGQFNMTHPLAAYFGTSNLYATTIANNSFITYSLVFSTMALPVLLWAKDFFTKQAVFFGLQGAIINCFRLFHLATGPFPDSVRRSQTNLYGIQVVQFKQ